MKSRYYESIIGKKWHLRSFVTPYRNTKKLESKTSRLNIDTEAKRSKIIGKKISCITSTDGRFSNDPKLKDATNIFISYGVNHV